MKIGTKIKKGREQQKEKLSKEIKLEIEHKQYRSLETLLKLTETREELNTTLYQRSKIMSLRNRSRYYVTGDKCGKLLARSIRDHQAL